MFPDKYQSLEFGQTIYSCILSSEMWPHLILDKDEGVNSLLHTPFLLKVNYGLYMHLNGSINSWA